MQRPHTETLASFDGVIVVFKTCTFCQFIWSSRNDFLNDRNTKIIGYQASFDNLRTGLFLFNHSCQSTLSVKVDHFLDLYKGTVYSEIKTRGPDCKGLCLNESELSPCGAECKFAYAREIIQIINQWKKHPE
jgi:hypothetical protein